MKKILCLIIILYLLPITNANPQNLSIEPTDSWMYESLNILNHYTPPDYFASQRPFWRDKLAKYIAKRVDYTAKDAPPVYKWECKRLINEQRSRSNLPISRENTPLWLKISPYSLNHFINQDEPLYRLGFKGEAALNIDQHFFAQLRGRLENKGELDSFAKVRKWKDKLTGYFNYALLGYRYKSIRLTFGRTFRAWGPWDNDRLLISTNSPSYNQISIGITTKKLAFLYWTAKLDHYQDRDGQRINRFFAAHRLAFKPHCRLELGLSETVLYGRKNSGWEFYYLNPILPFYWEQYNNKIDDNVYMGLDLTWWATTGLIIYGELLIDDFQIDFVSEPHQIGFNLGFSQIGLFLSPNLQIMADYTQIRNTVYTQNKFYNVYAHDRVVIGSSLGTDADRLRYKLTYHATPFLRVSLGGHYDRKGEGRYWDEYPQSVPDEEKFPSGRVQNRYDNYLEIEYLRGATVQGYLKIGYLAIKNVENQPENLYSPYISINLLCHFRQLFML